MPSQLPAMMQKHVGYNKKIQGVHSIEPQRLTPQPAALLQRCYLHQLVLQHLYVAPQHPVQYVPAGAAVVIRDAQL
jgi:hypothetical protein